jgi:hypothetical protein
VKGDVPNANIITLFGFDLSLNAKNSVIYFFAMSSQMGFFCDFFLKKMILNGAKLFFPYLFIK